MSGMDEAIEQYRLCAVDCAKKRSAAETLEERKKIRYAELVNQYRKDEKAISGAEYRARGSDAYKEIVEEYTTARTLANIAQAELKSRELSFEAWRSANAMKRAEMGLR